MNVAKRWHRVGTWLPALMVSAVAVALSPSMADAGCVHDGQSRGWHSDGVAYFDHLAALGAMQLPEDAHRGGPVVPARSPNRPCSGPTCSENPTAPMVPVAVAPAPGAGQWACLVDVASPPFGAYAFHIESNASVKPAHRGAGVFHPPRQAQV